MKNKISLFILCLAALDFSAAFAQTDTINTQTSRLLMNRLQEGSSRYAVYLVDSATNKMASGDIWERDIKIGAQTLTFQWKWYRGDSMLRYTRAICDRNNFAPLFEYSRSARQGVQAFKFKDGYMTREDTVAENKADPNRKIKLNPPAFNWEWDMEFFATLPIRNKGQKFVIAFVDPSDVKSAYYTYRVIGKETLKLNTAAGVACWLLKINYDPGSYGIFWICCKTGEMLKMKELYAGKYRYKVKLY